MWKSSYNRAIVEQGIKSNRSAMCVCVALTTKGNMESDLGARSRSLYMHHN